MTAPPATLSGRSIDLPQGELAYWPDFLAPERRAGLMARLEAELDWRQEHITLYGRRVPQPRLTAWYGDPRATYRYSGLTLEPRPWPALLADLRRAVVEHTGYGFNSVLCNLYRDGRDAMGWHSDNEPELGPAPVIASLSLGATRTFRLQHKKRKELSYRLPLIDGSLLLMAGDTQAHWRHALPREPSVTGPRINLTFRTILISA